MHSVRSRGRRHRKRRLVRELGGSRQGNRRPWWFSPDDRDWLCSPDRSRRCVSLHMLVTAAEFLLGPRKRFSPSRPSEGPNNVVISSEVQSRREAWRSVGPQTSDTAVWGRSPDISEWRDVVLESTEVAPDGQRLPYVQMNKPPVRRDRDRPYIAFETQSDQFPPWLSSLWCVPGQTTSWNIPQEEGPFQDPSNRIEILKH